MRRALNYFLGAKDKDGNNEGTSKDSLSGDGSNSGNCADNGGGGSEGDQEEIERNDLQTKGDGAVDINPNVEGEEAQKDGDVGGGGDDCDASTSSIEKETQDRLCEENVHEEGRDTTPMPQNDDVQEFRGSGQPINAPEKNRLSTINNQNSKIEKQSQNSCKSELLPSNSHTKLGEKEESSEEKERQTEEKERQTEEKRNAIGNIDGESCNGNSESKDNETGQEFNEVEDGATSSSSSKNTDNEHDNQEPSDEDGISINDCFSDEDDEIDEDDPFGFEADREQEALLEAFRLGSDDSPQQKQKDCINNAGKSVRTRSLIGSTNGNISTNGSDEEHHNKALFDILDRNFDDLDSFHVPSLNRLVTSDEVKLYFVAFVLVLTPQKPFSFAKEYNHDLDSKILPRYTNPNPDHLKATVSKEKRRWLFSRKKKEHDDIIIEEENYFESKKEEREESSIQGTLDDSYSYIPVPRDVVYALWIEVSTALGIIKDIDKESESVSLIVDYVQESLIELGLLEIEKIETPVYQFGSQDYSAHDSSNSSLSSASTATSKDSIISTKTDFYVVRHAINEQYALYLAQSSELTVIKDHIEKKKNWCIAATSVHNDLSNNCFDDYQLYMLPYLFTQSGKVHETKKLLCDQTYMSARLERLGILSSATVHLTDLDTLIRSLDMMDIGNESFDLGDFIISISAKLRHIIDERLMELHSENQNKKSIPEDTMMKHVMDAGKALHLVALLNGSFGYVEQELEYHALAVRLKESGSNQNEFGTVALSDSYHCMGLAYDNIGDFEEAMMCYDQALMFRRRLLGNDHIMVAETCHYMGSLLCDNNEMDNAYKLLEEALRLRIHHFGEDDEAVADTEQWLGNVMREMGKFDEALDYFKSSVKKKKVIFGDDHEDVADAMHNMAIVLDDLGKTELSLGCYQEALRIRKLIYGHDDIMVADTLFCLGSLCKTLDRPNKAFKFFKDSIGIREKLLATLEHDLTDESFIVPLEEPSDDVATRYKSLLDCYEEVLPLQKVLEDGALHEINFRERIGDIYSVLGSWDDAHTSYEAALKLKDENKSELQQKLGATCIRRGDYSKAQTYLNDAMVAKKRENGGETLLVFSIFYALGVSYFHLRQYQEAITAFSESQRIQKLYSTNVITMGHAQYWIGRSYYEIQDFPKATEFILYSLRKYNESRSSVKDEIIIRALHLLGNTHFKKKQIKLALKCYEEQIALCNEATENATLSDNCLTEAYFCAGNIHAKRKSYDHASDCYEKALATRHRFEGEENEKIAKILHKLGTIYLKKNEDIKAKEKLTDAHHLLQKLHGINDVFTATVEFKLGQIYDRLGDFSSAMDYYKQCLETREKIFGSEKEDVAIILFCLGKNARSRSKTDESIEYLEKALDIRRKIHSVNNDLIAEVLYELGRSYYHGTSTDKALLCYREALRIWKLLSDKSKASQVSFTIAEVFEEDKKVNLAIKSYLECNELTRNNHAKECIIHQRLGNLHESESNWDQAIYHLEKSRESCQESEQKVIVSVLLSLSRVYLNAKMYDQALLCNKDLVSHQSDSVSLADIFHNMGKIYIKLCQYDDSMEYLNKSLSIYRALGEQNEASIAKILLDVSKVNEFKADFEAASDCLVEALRTFKLKRDHKYTIETLNSLARTNECRHRFDAAKECYEECINLSREILGEKDSSVSQTLHDFGCLLIKMNKRSKALDIFESTLRLRKKLLGLENEDTIITITKIGEIYLYDKEYEAALRCFGQALTLISQLHGTNHIDFGTCSQTMGTIHYKEERFEEAIRYLKDAYTIQNAASETNMIRLSNTCHCLGHSLCKIGNYREAVPYLKKAVNMRKDNGKNSSIYYGESLAWLGEACYSCNNFKEALKYSTESYGILKRYENKPSLLFAQTQVCIAKVLFLDEYYDECLSKLNSSLQLYHDLGSEKDEKVAIIFFFKGKIFSKQKGKLNQAIDQFKKCLTIRRDRAEGVETETIAEVLIEVGDLLFDQGELSSALNCYLEGLRIRKKVHEGGALLASASFKVGKIYLKQEKHHDALILFEEARMYYSKCEDTLDIGILTFNIGLVHKECKRQQEALDSFIQAVGLLEKHLHSDNECMAFCLFHAGTIFFENRDYSKAIDFYRNALELHRGNDDANDEDIANTLKHLADVFAATDKINDALPLYTEASIIYKTHEKLADLANCFSQIGSIYLKADKLNDSLQFLEKAWNLHREENLSDENEASSILYGLGFIYNQKSRYQEAMDVLKISLKIRLKSLGKENIDVASTCEQLGTALVSLARYEDALKVCTTALEIYQKKLGENHICCARVMLDIGTIYCYKQNYDLSLVQLQACLQFFKNECGEDSEEVANVLLRVGQIHDLCVDHDEAMKCMTQALDIRTKIYGNDDGRVAETILNIARVLEDWGDVEEAMECFRNALIIYQQCNEHILVAEIHVEIGSIYNERKEYDSALDSYMKALTIFKSEVGSDSSEVGNTLRSIGAVYDAKNDVSASYKYYSESLKILRHALGAEDLAVSLVLNNLGINLARRKKYDKAFEFCKEALRIRRKKLPAGHLDIADTLFNIANILDDAKNEDGQAMRFYAEALSNYRSNFGDDNEDVANCFKSIGFIHMRRGESGEAIYKMSEALRIFRLKKGNNNIDVASLLYSIGRTYGKQAEYEKALGCFTECLKVRTELLGADHEDVASARKFMEAIQRKIGR